MRKSILIFVIIMISLSNYAQKVKIDKKRGIMTIDKVDVCGFETTKNKEGKETYTFTDLNSKDYVAIDLISGGANFEPYYIVTSSLSDKSSEIKQELVAFSLSNTGIITNLAVKKYNFFTHEGMNKQAIIDYLNTEYRGASEAIAEEMEAMAMEKEEEQAKKDRISDYSPIITGATVTNSDTREIIASFVRRGDGINIYTIKDYKNNSIAILGYKEPNNNTEYVVHTFDNRNFSFDTDHKKDPKLEAIEILIMNDYMGDDENSYIAQKAIEDQERAEAIAIAEEIDNENFKRSRVMGILTLINGEIVEGKFGIEFRQTPEGKQISNNKATNGIISLDGANSTRLLYFYKNENGKNKTKAYTKKDIKSFRIVSNENGNEELYVNVNYIEEPNSDKKPSLIDDGQIDVIGVLKGKPKEKEKSSMMYVASDKKRSTLYFFDKDIFIRDKTADRTIKLNRENFRSQLENIAKDCPSIVQDIKDWKFKYKQESILKFTDALEDCK